MHPEKYIPSSFHISFHFKVFRDLEGFWTCKRQVVSLWENLSKDSDLKCCYLDTQCFLQQSSVKLSPKKLLHFIFSLWTKIITLVVLRSFKTSSGAKCCYEASLRLGYENPGSSPNWFLWPEVDKVGKPKPAQPLQRPHVQSMETSAIALVKQ